MRMLTFTGYLKSYLKELTGSNSQSLLKLGKLAVVDSPRATEPVFLLAAMKERLPMLLQAVSNTHLEDEYRQIMKVFSSSTGLMAALQQNDPRLPLRYRKVYQSYRSRAHRVETDRNASLLMRTKALALMRKKGLSNYRVYSDLKLNPGNVNAFLKNSDPTKVSRTTARAILDYVESI